MEKFLYGIFLAFVLCGYLGSACPETRVQLETFEQFLNCFFSPRSVVDGSVTIYSLFDEGNPTALSEMSEHNSMSRVLFSLKRINVNLALRKVYCTAIIKMDADKNLSCPELKSNHLEVGFTCPETKQKMQETLMLSVALNAPIYLYCVNRSVPCVLQVNVEFDNNVVQCRKNEQIGTTPALLINDQCHLDLNSNNSIPGRNIRLVANKNTFVTSQKVLVKISFNAEDKVKPLGTCDVVEVVVDKELSNMKYCSSFTDPHFKTFYEITFDYMYPGEFLFYRDTKFNYEVRTTHYPCLGNEYPNVGCNGNVSVQAGDDVFVYTIHNDQLIEIPHINEPLTPGFRSEKMYFHCYKIYLPNGDSAKVELEGTLFSLTVRMWVQESKLKHIEGVCSISSLKSYEDDMNKYRFSSENTNFYGVPKQSSGNEQSWYCDCKKNDPRCVKKEANYDECITK